MAKQGAADIANFFSSFLEGYQTARGLKIAEEDRQRRIEREDFAFNQMLEAKEKEEAFAQGIQRAYKLLGHDNEVRQKFLQTKDLAKGINVPKSASGSYQADEPTDLLTDPDYLKYHSQELQKEIANLVSLNPNYNPKIFTDFLEKSDIQKATRQLSGLSSIMFSTMSMEDKATGLQPILQSMSGDKGLTVSLRDYEVQSRSDPNKKEIQQKFVFTKSDGSVIEKTSEEVASLTDIVPVIAGANDEYDVYYSTAQKMDDRRDLKTIQELSEKELRLKIGKGQIELDNLPFTLAANLKKTLGELSADKTKNIENAIAKIFKPISDDLNSVSNQYIESRKSIQDDGNSIQFNLDEISFDSEDKSKYKFDLNTVNSVADQIKTFIKNNLQATSELMLDDYSNASYSKALKSKPYSGLVESLYTSMSNAVFADAIQGGESNREFANFLEKNFDRGENNFFVYTGDSNDPKRIEQTKNKGIKFSLKEIESFVKNLKSTLGNATMQKIN